ncbi:MAG TPA: hypothetical protein P5046_00385, partial [Sphaerochaeta sp.]|nr:hypothetical protein [Sphaerochaeta sp.]
FISRNLPGSNTFRIIFFLPTVISASVYSLIFTFIFAVFRGPLNTVLEAMNLITRPIDWLGDPKWVMKSIIVVAVWADWETT